MKKNILFALAILLIALSCSKEETKKDKENQFTIGNFKYELGQYGLIDHTASSDLFSVIDLHLYSASIAWDESAEGFYGVGDMIVFNVYSPGITGVLQDGTYEFGTTYEGLPQLKNGRISYNIIYPLYTGDEFNTNDIVSGEVKVKYDETNDVYTITFKVELDNEENLSGSFTGQLAFYSSIISMLP